jgi:hypothetical protein
MGQIMFEKIKALIELNKIYHKGKEVNNMKPGYQTTEFWITSIVSVWSMFGGMVPAPYNAILPVIAGAIYTIARTLAKNGIIKGTVGEELSSKIE